MDAVATHIQSAWMNVSGCSKPHLCCSPGRVFPTLQKREHLGEEQWDGGFGHGDGANRPSQLLREENEVSIEFHGRMASRFASSGAALQVSSQPKR